MRRGHRDRDSDDRKSIGGSDVPPESGYEITPFIPYEPKPKRVRKSQAKPASWSWGVYVEPLPREVLEAQEARDKAFYAAFEEWKKANQDRALLLEREMRN